MPAPVGSDTTAFSSTYDDEPLTTLSIRTESGASWIAIGVWAAAMNSPFETETVISSVFRGTAGLLRYGCVAVNV